MHPSPTESETPEFNFDPTDSQSALEFSSQVGNWADTFGQSLHQRINFRRRPTVLGLFSGAGGLDIGFHDVGFDILETVEFEPKFVETLKENSGPGKYFGPTQRNTCIDIKDYRPDFDHVDFIIGGPPCQSFSAAGARASGVAGTRDARGELFREYARLLRELRPKGFLFENVYRIVGANGGKDWAEIVSAFLEVGYEIRYRILDAADYGTAQHRERLIIVGVRRDLAGEIDYRFPRPTHGPDSGPARPHVTAGAVLSGYSQHLSNRGIKGRYGELLNDIPPGLNYSYFTERMGHPRPVFAWRSKFSDFLYKADPARPVRTIKALGGQYTGPFHWGNRAFTVEELKRLQSFPDDYVICGRKNVQVQQIGNSVPPQLARMLAISIAAQLFDAKMDFKLEYLSHKEVLSFRQRKAKLTAHYELSAKRAIAQIISAKTTVSLQSYRADLDSDFSWKADAVDGEYQIDEKAQGSELAIRVSRDGALEDAGWEIYISPKEEWVLPYSAVVLSSASFAITEFTALWKAFDRFLIKNGLKADVVQLVNYYQYDPSVNLETLSFPDSPFGDLVRRLCHGQFRNSKFTLEELSRELRLGPGEGLPLLMELKKAGFEVRSASTNIAMEDESYLIPYAFPTLTRMSVQRTKALAS